LDSSVTHRALLIAQGGSYNQSRMMPVKTYRDVAHKS
jgi:hypothetical protein